MESHFDGMQGEISIDIVVKDGPVLVNSLRDRFRVESMIVHYRWENRAWKMFSVWASGPSILRDGSREGVSEGWYSPWALSRMAGCGEILDLVDKHRPKS